MSTTPAVPRSEREVSGPFAWLGHDGAATTEAFDRPATVEPHTDAYLPAEHHIDPLTMSTIVNWGLAIVLCLIAAALTFETFRAVTSASAPSATESNVRAVGARHSSSYDGAPSQTGRYPAEQLDHDHEHDDGPRDDSDDGDDPDDPAHVTPVVNVPVTHTPQPTYRQTVVPAPVAVPTTTPRATVPPDTVAVPYNPPK